MNIETSRLFGAVLSSKIKSVGIHNVSLLFDSEQSSG